MKLSQISTTLCATVISAYAHVQYMYSTCTCTYMYALWVTHTYINKHSPTSQRSQPTAVHTWATNRCWYAAVKCGWCHAQASAHPTPLSQLLHTHIQSQAATSPHEHAIRPCVHVSVVLEAIHLPPQCLCIEGHVQCTTHTQLQ